MKVLFLIIALFGASQISAVIIPSDRIVTWQGNVGVPGGITNRTVVYTNMTLIDNTGATDVTAPIQHALNVCPAEQVVLLPAGTFKVTLLQIVGPNTLRGAGPSLTTIDGQASGPGMTIQFGSDSTYNWIRNGSDVSTSVNINSGTAKDSTSIVVASVPSGMTNGALLYVDCLDDGGATWTVAALVNKCGSETGSCTRDIGRTGGTIPRDMCQIVQITNVTGTTIKFTPALCMEYNPYGTNVPQATAFPIPNTGNQYAGVENLKIQNNNLGNAYAVAFWRSAFCWLKNVEVSYPDGDFTYMSCAFRCEIRDSYFHDGWVHGAGSSDDCVRATHGSSWNLIENNIIRRYHIAVMLDFAGGGNVIGYNFMTNGFDAGNTANIYAACDYHGTHVPMTLWEGNVGTMINQDGGWGSGSHGTIFRNFFSGDNWCCPPFTGQGAEQTNSYTHQVNYVECVQLANNSKYFNVVGNELGHAGMLNLNSLACIYTNVWNAVRNSSNPYIMLLGYGAGSDGNGDPMDNVYPYTTLISHGNWDAVNNGVVWQATNSDHSLPNSYYLASKPAFFGALPFPPINPVTASIDNSNQIVTVPAVWRWFFGAVPQIPTGIQRTGGSSSGWNIK